MQIFYFQIVANRESENSGLGGGDILFKQSKSQKKVIFQFK